MQLIIPFGPKFTQAQQQKNFTKPTAEIGVNPLANYWQTSFAADTTLITYDLSLVEWIAAEQVAFLFGWIRNVKFQKKLVKVILPFRNNLSYSHYYSKEKLEQLAKVHIDASGQLFEENEQRVKRRARCNAFLLSIWGMIDKVGLQDHQNEFENLPDALAFVKQESKFHQNTHQIIPFTTLTLTTNYSSVQYDHYFQNLINDNLDPTVKTGRIFELQRDVQQLLEEFGCYSPFENKILSNVISQELYINSLQHSFDHKSDIIQLRESYIAAALSNKWSSMRSDHFINSFTHEKYSDTLNFYKDKKIISNKIAKYLQGRNTDLVRRKADVTQYMEDFRNISYLEFTYLDFGQGIHQTLKQQFLKDHASSAKKYSLSEGFTIAHEDSQIIEYAFLMDTSRNPLDYTVEFYAWVPRGLYFLVDMIRRYNGLLIVQSGWGKVVFDFSEKIMIEKKGTLVRAALEPVHVIHEAVQHVSKEQATYFPGTMYSIVLPEKQQKKKQFEQQRRSWSNNIISPVRAGDKILTNYMYGQNKHEMQEGVYPQELFKHERFDYISILFLYNGIIEQLRKLPKEIHVHDIYNKLFMAVNTAIDGMPNKNTIIFFDFAGLKTGNPSWIKIIYYLLNSPKINEQTKAIIVNLPADEEKVIKEIKENLTKNNTRNDKPFLHDPFLYRPIPCLNFKIANADNEQIEWIGVKDISDEPFLTKMLLQQGKEFNISSISNVSNVEGNFFVRTGDTITSTFSEFRGIKEIYFKLQQSAIARFLKSIIDGKEPTTENPAEIVYLTSNGGYQFQFLSLYELLHDKYVAHYFAKSLLDRYCNFIEKEITALETAGQEQPIQSFEEKIAGYRFNKIIAITVSSQLIGVAIRDLIEKDSAYSFLRTNTGTGLEQSPELILLSNYYSYDKEKSFERIQKNDQVIIVNDVISTGKLVEKLINQMHQVKQIPICGIFSIVDLRIKKEAKLSESEMDCQFFKNLEKYFFTLGSSRDNEPENRIILRKYVSPYNGTAEKKRINPLLNTVVELGSKHSEQNKILIKDLRKTLTQYSIGNKFFKIGHFQQNQTHSAFIANMRPLFLDKAGEELLKTLKKAYETPTERLIGLDLLKIHLTDIAEQLTSIMNGIANQKVKEALTNIHCDLQRLNREEHENYNTIDISPLTPDYIFYPHFSGIEKVPHATLSRIFGTHPDNIIGLQRFDTPKGWRFPFPPKRFNELTRNKHVLILDSGSLTGESLVQLIDNISFLDVKKITVLSVITRIDDFYREFYSRLRSIKVKKLRSKSWLLEDQMNSEAEEHIVPIEVLFGLALHIPVYASAVSCPFCIELEVYKNIIEISDPKPTKTVENYISKRRNELKCLLSAKDTLVNVSYLPKDRKTGEVDTASLFHMRDLFGRIDSYRFYPEYFDEFEQIEKLTRNRAGKVDVENLKEETKQEIECILICILHEPVLFDLVASLINGLNEPVTKYCRSLLFGPAEFRENSFYSWETYALVRLGFIIIRKDFYILENFETILSLKDKEANLLLHYEYWNMLYHPAVFGIDASKVDQMLQQFGNRMSKNLDEKNVIYASNNFEFYRLAVNKVSFESLLNYKDLDLPFKNLSNFVLKDKGEGRHFFLKQKINELYEALISTQPSLKFINQCLRDVVIQFDSLLKPNIEKILQDTSLKQHVGNIYRHLSKENKGIMYYILKTENFYNQLKEHKQEDINSLEPTLNQLSDLCEKMINEAFIREKEDSFLEVCQQYPCELKTELEGLRSRVKGKHTLEISHQNNYNGPVVINHQQTIFKLVLNQIIDNAIRIFENENLEMKISYAISEDLGIVTLIYSQIGKKFQQNGKEGGLTHIVKHYVERFRGSFKDNRDEDHDSFTIEIQLFLFDPEKVKNTNETA